MSSEIEPFDGGRLVHDAELVDEHQGDALAVVDELSRGEQLLAAWLLRCRTDNTRDAYRRDIEKWIEFLDELGVDLLLARGDHVELYQRRMETEPLPGTGSPAEPATIRRRLAVVSSLYQYGARREYVTRNPVEWVDRPQLDAGHSDTRSLTQDEARRLVQAAFGLVGEASAAYYRRVADRDSVIVATMLVTGLRVTEVARLDVGDLGYDRGYRVAFVTRKGNKPGKVALGAAAEMIDRRLAHTQQKSGPLFTTHSGGRVDRFWIFRAVRKISVAAAIPDPLSVSPHGLRHTFATLALQHGATLYDLQKALGHADPRTTMRYEHVMNIIERSPVHSVGPAVLKGNNDQTSRLF